MDHNNTNKTKSSTKAKSKYNKKNYVRTLITLRHKEMNILNNHCQKYGYSKNGFILQAIKDRIEKDTGKSFDEFLKEQQQEQDPEEPKDKKGSKIPEVFKLDQ